MAVAAAVHHSAPRRPTTATARNDAPRGQRTQCDEWHRPPAPVARHSLAADMELETNCIQAVCLLLIEAPFWSELPTPCLHVAHRCLIFRMASRIGCCVGQMLRAQHRSLPIALFRLLRTPTEATAKELMATPECLRDSWSAHFLKEYPDPYADEALDALTAIAALWDADPRGELQRTVRAIHGTAAPQWEDAICAQRLRAEAWRQGAAAAVQETEGLEVWRRWWATQVLLCSVASTQAQHADTRRCAHVARRCLPR